MNRNDSHDQRAARPSVSGFLRGACTLAAAIAGSILFASGAAAVPPQPRAGEPLVGLTASQSFRFHEGREYYEAPLTVADGLGPGFNQTSCVACHETPVGGWGATRVTRFGNLSGGTFNFLEQFGGPVLQRMAISPACLETAPPPSIANHVRDRVTPSVLAFGLVEAIPDAAIVALEDPTDANGDGISGRAHRVHTLEDPAGPLRIGRFGWKSQVATVRTFSADAARNEMGLTNALLPLETAPNGDAALLASCDAVLEIEDRPDAFGATFVDRVTDFQRFLGPPPQAPKGGMAGETLFNGIGCVKCHVREFTTSSASSFEPVLRGRVIRPYSDFLLHDMGILADGIPDGQALGSEMRTPPLWNLRTRPVLLHDGSADQPVFAQRVEAAILAHAGEGIASRNAYAALSTADKGKVIAFLDSLGRNDFDADGDGLLTNLDYGVVVANAGDPLVSPDEAWAVADLDQNGQVSAAEVDQLRALLGIPSDCNQNGVADATEIANGSTVDANGNGVPDECDQSSCTARVKRVTATGGAIPDAGGGSLVRTMTVTAPAGNPAIQSLRVTLNIDHTWLSDLTITLRRGTDAPVTLHTGCGSFHDVHGRYLLTDSAWEGAGGALVPICQGTLLDGGGTNSETRFTFAPGLYRPAQGTAATAFQTMRGQSMAATWTLTITDGRTNDVGTLNGWSIDFRYADPAPVDCDGAGGADCAQIAANPALDCDHDGVIDSCQTLAGDCNANGVRDRCEIASGAAFDCNANGVLDSCDIAVGTARDCNGNGVPDSCELVDGDAVDSDSDAILDSCEWAFGDLNLDGVVNAADLAVVLSLWGSANPAFGDFDGDGIVAASDLAVILGKWDQAPPWMAPGISSVAPSSGPTSGGTAITITGTNLTGTTSVTVGGAAATSVSVVSATTVTAVTPAGTAGARDVSVTTPVGTATKSGAFTYQVAPPPTISSISPNQGATGGGTAITITGTNLTGTNSVTIGGVTATSVSVVSATTVTAVTPAGTAGAKTVSLTTPGGTANLTNGFTYVAAPTISSVSPNQGPTVGGTAITIMGTNLTGTSSVTIGGAAATSLSVVSATTVTAVTPPGSIGAGDIVVTTPGGLATLADGFTFGDSGVWYTILEQNPDPAIVTSATLRNAITATGYPWRVRDNGTNIEMVLIPPGTFNMGCSASNSYSCFSEESPVHSVTLTGAFYLGRYEVTQAQWIARMGSNPSYFVARPENGNTANTNRPVETVSWNQIAGTGGFLSGTGLRLPTEAEWEYAYRAGTTTAFHGFTGYLNGTNDDTLVGNIAWFSGNNGASGTTTYGTKAVGQKLPNGFGLHDMAGNVFEWVNDWYGGYSSAAQTNPSGPATGTDRVLRNGPWNAVVYGVRSSYRVYTTPSHSNSSIGFRVARAPASDPPAITSLTPNAGPTVGGTAITITGTNLTGTTSVTIGGVSATSVSVVSTTTVTAVTPAGTAGAKTVSLTTPGGTANLTNGFTYGLGPTISSVSPNVGPTTGGTAITITGTNLTGTSSVTVGGNPATSVSVVNATTVTAVTPAGTAGAANVSLTTPYGSTTANGAFTYQLYGTPTISAVNPNSGPLAGGTAITITGTNLTGTGAVSIGGVAATSVSVVNATTVTAVTPAGTAGAKTVSVTTPGGTANLSNGFTYTSVWYTVLEQNPDPAIVTSATLRNAITATGYPWRVRDNGTNIEMVLIPPGTFNMGCSAQTGGACGAEESPVHGVTLSQPFYIGRYEVTQAQWTAKMGTNPSYFQSASAQVPAAQVPNRPVDGVSSSGIQAFLTATGMRLPTEAEWEYAYRAGTTTAFHGWAAQPAGTNDPSLVGEIAWYFSNANSQSHPVGLKAANGFGLHDMAGNALERVSDVFGSSYYATSPSVDPQGPATGDAFVQRGGNWNNSSSFVRASYRYGSTFVLNGVHGFRVARTLAVEPPTIGSVSPNSGPLAGGTAITITGTNLTGTSTVTIGGVAATSVSVVSATTVTAVTPAGTAGAKTVSVTTSGGTANLANGFTYTSVWYTVLEQNPDPAIVTSATLRDAITATGYPWRVRDNGTNIEMVLIPPGTFNMGCSASHLYSCSSAESPVHAVTLTNAFYLGRYEVTQAQWIARMGSNPSYWVARPENGNTANTNRPVETVSWNQIAGTGGFLTDTGLRLPTEAEWEYAYRAGTTTAFHGFTGYLNGTNDDTLVGSIAWFSGNNGAYGTTTYGTKAVGQKLANGFGLHDMGGNVWEWVNDWYGSTYYSSSPSTNPPGPASGTDRVLRGGSWGDSTFYVRSSNRYYFYAPDDANSYIGFRVARAPL